MRDKVLPTCVDQGQLVPAPQSVPFLISALRLRAERLFNLLLKPFLQGLFLKARALFLGCHRCCFTWALLGCQGWKLASYFLSSSWGITLWTKHGKKPLKEPDKMPPRYLMHSCEKATWAFTYSFNVNFLDTRLGDGAMRPLFLKT